MENVNRVQPPGWERAIDNLNTYLSQELFGGPKSNGYIWPSMGLMVSVGCLSISLFVIRSGK